MSADILDLLEFTKLRGILARLTATEPGRELADTLLPLPSRDAAAASLAAIAEMQRLIVAQGPPPVGGCRDLREPLRQLRAEGSFLVPLLLLDVLSSLEAAVDCRKALAEKSELPLLAALGAELAGCRELRGAIRESIGARGEILDSASFELGEVRLQIRQWRGRIRNLLENLLASDQLAAAFQDRIITERGGRYVVPVRADHRGQVKGFVHDESASGQTLYVEPVAVLKGNNELQHLLREEKREEERILRRLSALVRREDQPLRANQQLLARLDYLAAAARLALQTEAIAPQLSEEPLIELRGARHPLLLVQPDGRPRPQGATPVDLLLGAEQAALVISGPNTGGKTVALKTFGLLVLMVRAGLPIPCLPGSRLYLFGQVFADIGDEQSIEENLSTFSGHLSRIRKILQAADGDSLVLLDEAGTGTDPAEGGALAMAILDSLRERGARCVLTTHLNLVKGYADLTAGVVNAAVEFDSATLAPTYRLFYGIPGASSAFTIARGLGLPESVLERANAYLGEGERFGLDLVEKLNGLRRDLDRELYEARSLKAQAEAERNRRKQLLKELEEQKREVLEKARQRGEQLVRQTEGRIKGLLDQARALAPDTREQARLAAEVRDVRQSLVELAPAPQRQGRLPQEVKLGELLRVTALGAEGEVTRLLADGVELSILGKKLRQPLSALEQFQPRRFASRAKPRGGGRGQIEREGFSSRLLLVGKRVDEALPVLERFLDDALLHSQRQLEVVHGSGEGVLRKVVREFLAGHREVTAFHAADLASGGDNVTIVELKGE
jgi:DNA mismatch repair protein MutS2